MGNDAKRTPGKWTTKKSKGTSGDVGILANGALIAEVYHMIGYTITADAEANAAFIVRACNAHDALVAVLLGVEWGAHPNYCFAQYCPSCHMARTAGHTDDCKLEAAIALATEANDGE